MKLKIFPAKNAGPGIGQKISSGTVDDPKNNAPIKVSNRPGSIWSHWPIL